MIARRFRCDAVLIFTERFAERVLAPSARRTGRLDSIVQHFALALGGRPAAAFTKRLMLPVNKDTLVRVLRRRHVPPADPLRAIGIDDWAWRNHRYASINLQPGTAPDRHAAAGQPATAQAWLTAHPTISVVARDHGGGYGEAAARALQHAVQVADCWFASDRKRQSGLSRCGPQSMRQIRSAIDATAIDRKLLPAAERLQYEGYLRREETNAAILALSKNGLPSSKCYRPATARKMVRQVTRGERDDVFRTQQSSLDQHCHGSTINGRPAAETALSFGPDHAPQARQTSNVRPRKKSICFKPDWSAQNKRSCTKIASEPNLQAD